MLCIYEACHRSSDAQSATTFFSRAYFPTKNGRRCTDDVPACKSDINLAKNKIILLILTPAQKKERGEERFIGHVAIYHFLKTMQESEFKIILITMDEKIILFVNNANVIYYNFIYHELISFYIFFI
jgi:hypothetical protein